MEIDCDNVAPVRVSIIYICMTSDWISCNENKLSIWNYIKYLSNYLNPFPVSW